MTNNTKLIIDALQDDGESQIAYAGKVTQTEHISIIDSHGNVHEKEVEIYISWGSIAKILNLVRERAGINK